MYSQLWEEFGRTLGGHWEEYSQLWLDSAGRTLRTLGGFGRTLGGLWKDFGRTLGGLWEDNGRTLGLD